MSLYISLAIFILLAVWLLSRTTRRDPAAQLEKLKQAAGAGDVYAQFMFAEHLLNTENNPECAVRWYRLAAQQGHLKAQFILGCMLAEGNGVHRDITEGRKWISEAAAQEYPAACQYMQQQRPEISTTESDTTDEDRVDIEAIRQLAMEGDPKAQYELGAIYYHGISIAADHSEALRWFTMAAEQEDTDAQYNLGIMFGRGEGTPKDITQSMNWFRRASDNGHAEAAELLSKLAGEKTRNDRSACPEA